MSGAESIGMVLGLALIGLIVVGLLRTLIPLFTDVGRRTLLHGPAPTASPGGTGVWAGWVTTLFWSLAERNREELYEHVRHIGVQRSDVAESEREAAAAAAVEHPEIDLPPSFTHQIRPTQPPARVAHAEPVLSPDRRWWWDGRSWRDTERFVPVGARFNGDGSRWFDGDRWRVAPQRLPQRRGMPRLSNWAPPEHEDETWLTARGQGMNPLRPPQHGPVNHR